MIKDDNLILSFAGHDPTGGAGIQVDAQIANHHGKHCLSILTCETIQNLKSFEKIIPQEEKYIQASFNNLLKNFSLKYFKIGLIPNIKIAHKLDSLIAIRTLDLLVLTGDVVAHPTPENWETVRAELDSLAIGEWHISPGNHDISPYMDEHIQPEKYMALERGNSLFLILNTSFPGWTVD